MKAPVFEASLKSHLNRPSNQPGKLVLLIVKPIMSYLINWAIKSCKSWLKEKGYIDERTGDIML